MKNTVLILSAILLFALTANAQTADWAKFSRYRNSNINLTAKPANGNRVVFFGNSITDNWPHRSAQFWKDHPDYVGRGISGQSSYNMLSRFREDVVNLNPTAVVINAGTNDIAENSHPYNEDITLGNIMSMVEIARANGISVILTSVLPAGHFSWREAITDGPEKIKALNARIKAYADNENIPYVDYYSVLISEDGRNMTAEYTNDGVHPVKEGYAVMEAEVVPVIEKTLKNRR